MLELYSSKESLRGTWKWSFGKVSRLLDAINKSSRSTNKRQTADGAGHALIFKKILTQNCTERSVSESLQSADLNKLDQRNDIMFSLI